MTKKYATFVIASIFSCNSYAKHSAPEMLYVSLQNTGTSSCTLVTSNIESGKLYKSKIPTNLRFSGEKYDFTIYGKVAEISLTYNCHDQKEFSIYMKKYYKKMGYATVIDEVTKSKDVFVTNKVKPGYFKCVGGPMYPVCTFNATYIDWNISN